MNRRKVEDYAHKYSLSFNAAKRRLGKRATKDAALSMPTRGMAVAGTGKGGVSKKGKKG